MKVVFVGASKFGLRCLEAIRTLPGMRVVGVVTNQREFNISYSPTGVSNVLHANFEEYSVQHSIPCYTMRDTMAEDGLRKSIEVWQPDIMIVVGWYHMVPKSILAVVPTYGMHASLLPDYSGGAPLVWAIINGENKTGISLFQFWDGIDNGPVVGQLETPILEADDISTVYDRIEVLGISLLRHNLPLLASGEAIHLEQDESKRRIFPQRNPSDGVIEWLLCAADIYDFVRAQTHPYPGAFTTLDGKKINIWCAALCELEVSETFGVGKIIVRGMNVYVVCGDSTLLWIKQVESDDVEQDAWEWYSQLEQLSGHFFQ